MDSLILDILNYSRVAKSDMQIEAVDLDALITDVRAEYPQFAEAEIIIQAPVGAVYGHKAALGQVISNLLITSWSRIRRSKSDPLVVTGLQNAPAPYVFPVDFLEGSKDFKSETELAYELGYRAALGPLVSVSVSGFYNVYNNLRSTSATPVTALYPFPYPVYFQNNLEGHTQGMELTANYQVLNW